MIDKMPSCQDTLKYSKKLHCGHYINMYLEKLISIKKHYIQSLASQEKCINVKFAI